jgi:hypothetical protein
MKFTIFVDDEVMARVRRRADALGTSVEDLVREYLGGLGDADAFEQLSGLSHGDSRGWKFNREEIHERR